MYAYMIQSKWLEFNNHRIYNLMKQIKYFHIQHLPVFCWNEDFSYQN